MNRFQLALPLLFMAAAAAAADAGSATPEATLLAGLAPEYRETQQRCEQLAGRFDAIERTLSLYREELANLHVSVDGARLAELSTGALRLLAFESRLLGPASATMTIDPRKAVSITQLTPGRRIEISFTDRAGKAHPLFCGFAAVVRPDPASGFTDVVALVPRAGAGLEQSAQYQDQTCVDVLAGLAQSAGLGVEVTDSRPRSIYPVISRKHLATWPFMCQVARLCQLDLSLRTDGKLLVAAGSFMRPPAPAPRTWSDMSWVEVAKSLAQSAGRAPDIRLTGTYPPTNFRQTTADEDFLLEISIAAEASAWFTSGKLILGDDGVWLRDPIARPAPEGTTDLLLKRVTVTGSLLAQRVFSRRYPDLKAQALDPERVPGVQATLLLGRAMPAAKLPAFPLADAVQIASALEATLARLGSRPATADQRFLQDFARLYRPTLLYLYRLRPDGARILDAIGR